MSCKHALLRHNVFTLLPQTLSQKSFKKSKLSRNSPEKKTKKPPLETSKPKKMLKMTHVRSKKQKCENKSKRVLGSGRHYSQNQEYSVRNLRF